MSCLSHGASMALWLRTVQIARATCLGFLVWLCLSDPCGFSTHAGCRSRLMQERGLMAATRHPRSGRGPLALTAEPLRRSQLLEWSTGALGLMGWAGWLGQGQADEGNEVVRLGLGAERIEDATRWELSFFQSTLDAVARRASQTDRVLYHYTDLASAAAILKGRRGIRLSRGGYKGGGVFFSKMGPLDGLSELELRGQGRLWQDVFPAFQSAQLQRNYGTDILGREHKADAVLVCVAPQSMLEDIPDRTNSCFIPLESFETFAAEYFAFRNIPRAYRLVP